MAAAQPPRAVGDGCHSVRSVGGIFAKQFQVVAGGEANKGVLGKPASVFALQGADKLNLVEGGRFSLRLENDLKEGTIIHWHGLTPPSAFDGSPVAQGIVKHGSSFEYDIVINRSGTYWMHSHVGHRHHLYHFHGGMAGLVDYEA